MTKKGRKISIAMKQRWAEAIENGRNFRGGHKKSLTAFSLSSTPTGPYCSWCGQKTKDEVK